MGERRDGSLKRQVLCVLGLCTCGPQNLSTCPGLTGWATSLGGLELPAVHQAHSPFPHQCAFHPLPSALGGTRARNAKPPQSPATGGALWNMLSTDECEVLLECFCPHGTGFRTHFGNWSWHAPASPDQHWFCPVFIQYFGGL